MKCLTGFLYRVIYLISPAYHCLPLFLNTICNCSRPEFFGPPEYNLANPSPDLSCGLLLYFYLDIFFRIFCRPLPHSVQVYRQHCQQFYVLANTCGLYIFNHSFPCLHFLLRPRTGEQMLAYQECYGYHSLKNRHHIIMLTWIWAICWLVPVSSIFNGPTWFLLPSVL